LSDASSTALGFVFGGVTIEDDGLEIAVNFGGGFVDGIDVYRVSASNFVTFSTDKMFKLVVTVDFLFKIGQIVVND